MATEKKTQRTYTGGMAPSSDGSSGGSLSGPGNDRYRHTQIGRIQIYAVVIACGIGILSFIFVGMFLPLIIVAAGLLIGLALFSTMTIELTQAELVMHFGPLPVIRKRIRLAEIASAIPVKNPWYYGWGVHYTPRGWLYNIAGVDAAELLLVSGKILRIGTDEPEVLTKAIRDAAQ
jgi:hypothetical protein